MPFAACDSCRKYFAVARDGDHEDARLRNLCPGCGAALRSCTSLEALSFVEVQHGRPTSSEGEAAARDPSMGSKGGSVSAGDWVLCRRGQHLGPAGSACPFCLQETWNQGRMLRRRFQEALRARQRARWGAVAVLENEPGDPPASGVLLREPLVPPRQRAVADTEAAGLADLPSLLTRFHKRQAELACANARELVSDAEEIVLRSRALVRQSQGLRRARARARPESPAASAVLEPPSDPSPDRNGRPSS